jgi:hypothetical protein
MQKTLFDESETKEEEEEPEEGIEEDIKIGIRIAEAEMDHNIREAFNNLKNKAKKKKAKQLLQEITTISLSGDEDDKAIVTFAKVLQLEKVLGIS